MASIEVNIWRTEGENWINPSSDPNVSAVSNTLTSSLASHSFLKTIVISSLDHSMENCGCGIFRIRRCLYHTLGATSILPFRWLCGMKWEWSSSLLFPSLRVENSLWSEPTMENATSTRLMWVETWAFHYSQMNNCSNWSTIQWWMFDLLEERMLEVTKWLDWQFMEINCSWPAMIHAFECTMWETRRSLASSRYDHALFYFISYLKSRYKSYD